MDKTFFDKVKNVLDMYKKEQVNEYVLERELANFMGEKSHVMISKDNKNVMSKTFAVFVLPAMMSDGFHVTYVVDNHAIKQFFSTDEMTVILMRIRDMKQKLLVKFNAFIRDHKDTHLSYNECMGFFLGLYADYMSAFRFKDKNEMHLNADSEILKLSDKFSAEDAVSEDIESLIINGYISEEVADIVKKYCHGASDDVKIIENADDTPIMFKAHKDMLKYATGTLGVRDHKEIAHDYQPPR